MLTNKESGTVCNFGSSLVLMQGRWRADQVVPYECCRFPTCSSITDPSTSSWPYERCRFPTCSTITDLRTSRGCFTSWWLLWPSWVVACILEREVLENLKLLNLAPFGRGQVPLASKPVSPYRRFRPASMSLTLWQAVEGLGGGLRLLAALWPAALTAARKVMAQQVGQAKEGFVDIGPCGG